MVKRNHHVMWTGSQKIAIVREALRLVDWEPSKVTPAVISKANRNVLESDFHRNVTGSHQITWVPEVVAEIRRQDAIELAKQNEAIEKAEQEALAATEAKRKLEQETGSREALSAFSLEDLLAEVRFRINSFNSMLNDMPAIAAPRKSVQEVKADDLPSAPKKKKVLIFGCQPSQANAVAEDVPEVEVLYQSDRVSGKRAFDMAKGKDLVVGMTNFMDKSMEGSISSLYTYVRVPGGASNIARTIRTKLGLEPTA